MTTVTTTALNEVIEGLFDGDPEVYVTETTDRYEYKKKGGSSDAPQTYDSFEV
ncbi:hypothetical protein GCM10009639_49170 [Kitasatospora putterlickiae]|uniref:Uncharacterized protein n=1 Tax=Kitasatospora putterlickiae TaxID=221725 RepID=A0ABP4J4M6_9ACTN